MAESRLNTLAKCLARAKRVQLKHLYSYKSAMLALAVEFLSNVHVRIARLRQARNRRVRLHCGT